MVTQQKRELLPLESRENLGKTAAKRLRREGLVPVLVYSAGQPPLLAQVQEPPLVRILKRGLPLTQLKLPAGNEIMSTIKEVQYEPVSDRPLHVDFMEVHAGESITVSVSVRAVGEARGVREGGVLDVHFREVQVSGIPSALPDGLEVGVSELDVGEGLSLGDIPLPEGVELAMDPSLALVSVVPPTSLVEEEEAAEEEVALEEGELPEGEAAVEEEEASEES